MEETFQKGGFIDDEREGERARLRNPDGCFPGLDGD